jgi:putative membrane protein insertion efficiency factor
MLHRFLRSRSRRPGCKLRPEDRIHDSPRVGQSCGAEPHSPSDARSRPFGTGASEFGVAHRIQSPPEIARVPVPGFAVRGQKAFSSHPGAGLSPAVPLCAGLLAGYKRLISPLLPSACRFYPSCSVYMRDAMIEHGVAHGLWLGLKRLSRCHPFHPGGCDPVPRRVA